MFIIQKNKIEYITKLNKNILDICFSNNILNGVGLEEFKKVNCNFNQYYYFKNNNSNILGIAHLDTIQQDEWYFVNNNYLYSPLVDDRMGVYSLLYLLPKLGCNFDILLTTDEEYCNSSAQFFHTDKQYNWMFQFDRMGNDVVTYDYYNKDIYKTFDELNIKTNLGIYSDICELEHLNCFGMNFGTGYYNNHNIDAYVDLKMFMKQILKFVKIYNQYKDIYLNTEFNIKNNFKYKYQFNNYRYVDNWL